MESLGGPARKRYCAGACSTASKCRKAAPKCCVAFAILAAFGMPVAWGQIVIAQGGAAQANPQRAASDVVESARRDNQVPLTQQSTAHGYNEVQVPSVDNLTALEARRRLEERGLQIVPLTEAQQRRRQ